MSDGIGDRLLGNPEEVGGHQDIVHQNRAATFEFTADGKQMFRLFTKLTQRRHQTIRRGIDGLRPPGQAPRLDDGLFDYLLNPLQTTGIRA